MYTSTTCNKISECTIPDFSIQKILFVPFHSVPDFSIPPTCCAWTRDNKLLCSTSDNAISEYNYVFIV